MFTWRKCWKETEDQAWWNRVFACVPSVIDFGWRQRDFRFHRSWGGLGQRWLGLDGHSPLVFILAAVLLALLIFGPTLGWRGMGALAVWLLSLVVLYLAARRFGASYLMDAQIVLMTLFMGVGWFWPGAREALEWGDGVYRHAFGPLFLLLVGGPLVIVKYLNGWVFKGLRGGPGFGRLLPHADLFAPSPRPPKVTFSGIVRSFVRAPVDYTLHLPFFPALVLLLVPYRFASWGWTFVFVAVTWVLVSFSGYHERFNSMLTLLRRAFFIGGQLVVSLVIIGLAVGRVAGFSYVQTVVESSSLYTMICYTGAAYVLFWFFEYWLNRRLLEELVGLLQRPGEPIGQATYDVDPDEPFAKTTGIELVGRKVQVHGGGRLISIGQLGEGGEAFETWEKKAFFDRLVERASWSAEVGSDARSPRTRKQLTVLKRRIDFYFGFTNLLLIVLVVCFVSLLSGFPQLPLAEVTSPTAKNGSAGVDLARLIWNDGPREDVVLLAASGGGTRAALYTQSVLRGLHSIGALDRVVLASGVSGGGMALAYYAARIDELGPGATGPGTTEPGATGEASWDEFRCDMSRPFIRDVLEGVSEWRIVTGTRSGKLLAESFCRAFFDDCPLLSGSTAGLALAEHVVPPGRQNEGTFNGLERMGLILNTALAGHLECPGCGDDGEFYRVASEKARREQTDGSVAGGRLIFTNLSHAEAFPHQAETISSDEDLPTGDSGPDFRYVVVQDLDVAYSTVAALNANFPPVFSNAPVDRDGTDRYWVTDGGATDNRGLISLLYALREALGRIPADRDALPDIHIVLAEASAGTTGYTQDRGIGTKFGAPGQIANGLIDELLREVIGRYEEAGGHVIYHDLAMPEFMRIDGGLGTHWMLPRYVEFENPGGEGAARVRLSGYAARQIVDNLHQPRASPSLEVERCARERRFWLDRTTQRDVETVLGWTEVGPHREVWDGLKSELGDG